MPQLGYMGTAAPGHCGHLMGTCGQFRPTRHSKLGHYSDIIPGNYQFHFLELENHLGVSHQIWGQGEPGYCWRSRICVLKTCQDPSTHIAPKHQDTGKEEQNIKRKSLSSFFHRMLSSRNLLRWNKMARGSWFVKAFNRGKAIDNRTFLLVKPCVTS